MTTTPDTPEEAAKRGKNVLLQEIHGHRHNGDGSPESCLSCLAWATNIVGSLAFCGLVIATDPREVPATGDRVLDETLKERDEAIEWADRLAAAIATEDVIGEHSNGNNPWRNAIDYAASLGLPRRDPTPARVIGSYFAAEYRGSGPRGGMVWQARGYGLTARAEVLPTLGRGLVRGRSFTRAAATGSPAMVGIQLVRVTPDELNPSKPVVEIFAEESRPADATPSQLPASPSLGVGERDAALAEAVQEDAEVDALAEEQRKLEECTELADCDAELHVDTCPKG